MFTFQYNLPPKEPHLREVLEFVMANRHSHNLVIVRYPVTAQIIATLLPELGPTIVTHANAGSSPLHVSLDTAIDRMRNGTTNLIMGTEQLMSQGWQPPFPERATVSCTYPMRMSVATQFIGRLRSTDDPARQLVWMHEDDRIEYERMHRDPYGRPL